VFGSADAARLHALTFSPARLFLLATFHTSTIEFHEMVGDLKTVTLGNPLLKGFKRRVLELNNLSAIETDEVIVVASF